MSDFYEGAPWRHPHEESVGLYPGLVVHDARQSGSITVGKTRLPVWAFAEVAVTHGWAEVESGWSPSEYGFNAEDFGEFIGNLMEMRGEFARLLLVLANAERSELRSRKSWYERKGVRRRVAKQLKRCLDALDDEP